MASLPPPPSRDKLPVLNGWAEMPRAWIKWFTDLANQAAETVTVTWSSISKTGSSLADLETRNHSALQNLNTADHAHLYLADRDQLVAGDDTVLHYHDSDRDSDNFFGTEWTDLTDAGATILHKHDHALQDNLNSANYTHLTATNHTDLTDGGVTTLHKHETTYVNYPAALAIGVPTHIATIQDLLDHSWSAGIVDGCGLTDNADGTIGIATGNATLRSTADPHSALYNVKVSAQTPISLTDDSTNYVYLDYNAGSPTFVASTSVSAFNGMNKILAWVVHRAGTVIHYLDARDINVDNARKAAHMFLDFSRFIHAEGGTVLGSPSGLTISVTAGHFYFMLNELTHPAFDTSVAGTANENVFSLWNHVASVYTETANTKVIDSTLYDNGTGTATIGNNKYGVTWFFIVNDSPSELHAVMGQAEYANLADARVASVPATLPSIISGLGSLIGFVIYQKSATSFADIRSAFTAQTSSSAATTHNGLSGLQGGTINEYYHLTSAQKTVADTVLGASAVAAFDSLAPTTTQGDIIYHNGTDNVRLAKGTAGQILAMNAGATAPEWIAKLTGYTVATLPAGTVGDRAYVTDATTPTWLAALTGGGAVTCPVFYNGAVWVSA